MQIIDTHCHIHDSEFNATYDITIDEQIEAAKAVGVMQYICVGTSAQSSAAAVTFAATHDGAYASLALHPHEAAEKGLQTCLKEFHRLEELLKSKAQKIVAIGECGLDYYYHPEKAVQNAQKELFAKHLDLALAYDLPLIFHIRDAFDDFFTILDTYAQKGHTIRGVVHSFSAHEQQLQGCLQRGLYIGLNGIMTFTKDALQLSAAKSAPLSRLVVETDAPFLTPKPFRGTMCQLKHVVVTAEFLSDLRGESLQQFAEATTANAKSLFSL